MADVALNLADFYDAELARHNAHLQVAAAVGRSDHVLDIGCGSGQTTRDAASAADRGRAHGIDLSVPMLQIARQRSSVERLTNATFEAGDAQNHVFAQAAFDLCISRFGVMFFADPAAAFTNIASAIKPGGRFAFMVWQSQDRNEWATAIHEALDPNLTVQATAGRAFSLSEPSVTAALLETAGFSGIAFLEIDEPVFYGPDPATALATIATFDTVRKALALPGAVPAIRVRLLAMLEKHQTHQGVQFQSLAWMVTGYRVDAKQAATRRLALPPIEAS